MNPSPIKGESDNLVFKGRIPKRWVKIKERGGVSPLSELTRLLHLRYSIDHVLSVLKRDVQDFFKGYTKEGLHPFLDLQTLTYGLLSM